MVIQMLKVKISNQSEFEQVVVKMQKETDFKCNISDGSGSISCKNI